ncbi:MAG: hypothetical protein IT373_33650 [Polyangiaceae bacterium]|nr:hypothetical protein [Polyangiaceae bacterium]
MTLLPVAALLLFVGAAYLLLRGALLFAALRAALAARYHVREAQAVEGERIPERLRELLERVAAWRALGFEHVAWVVGGPAFTLPPHEPAPWRLMARPGSAVRLWLQVTPLPEPANELLACLITDFEDGVRVETDDVPGGVSWPAQPAWARVELVGGLAPAALLARHEVAVGAIAGAAVDDGPEGALARYLRYHREATELAVARGDLVPTTSPGCFAVSLRGALAVALRALRGRAAGQRARRARRLAAPEAPAVPVAAEVAVWEEQDAMRDHPTPRWLLAVALGVTGVLFAGSLLLFASPTTVAGITLVVLLHEIGHWTAMRMRGYRDARIFFVPLLGGATTGHKERISLADEMIVLLAGPVPGLGLGLGLAVLLSGPQPALLRDVTRLLIVINGLNLLPIFPLDGGRLAHRLLASGRPEPEIVLRTLSGLGLVALGIGLRSPVIAALGAFVLAGTPSAWRSARLERTLRERGLPGERATRRTEILAALRATDPGAALGVRISRARNLATRLDAPAARPAARWAWFGVYAVVVAAAFAIPAALVTAERAWWRPEATSPSAATHARIGCADVPSLRLGPARTLVTLHPEGAASLRAASEQLEAYTKLFPFACVRPPWAPGALDAVRAHRVAHTMTLLTDALEAAASEAPTGRGSGGQAGDDGWGIARGALHGAVLGVVAEHEQDGDFDRALALAWLETVEAGPTPANRARLGTVLGLESDCGREPRAFWWNGRQAVLTVESAAEVEPLAGYLCKAGARAFRVTMEPLGDAGP